MFARVAAVSIFALVLSSPPGPLMAGPALDRVRESGLLVAAADTTWPPFSWRDPMGEFHGFDVEVTRAIAQELGARVEFVTPSWEEQVEGDWDGRWDIAVTNITPTADRAERLDFPAIYVHGFAALAVRADEPGPRAPEEASGLRVGVVEDTLYERYLRGEDLGVESLQKLERLIADAEVVSFANTAAPYRTLVEGRIVDAIVDDLIAIKAQIAQGRPIRVVGDPLFAAPAAVAIEAGDPEFAAELARIVEGLHADGTLRGLSLKWFDADLTVAATAR
jgi:polar amino acid transport system substrate-binding protein